MTERNWHEAPCCMLMGEPPCICGTDERALRSYVAHLMPSPMTPEQREWCLQEIDQIEGWSRKDYENEEDDELARSVISAWNDYCRDKGLI